jgi:hypothetical protein
MIDLLTKGDVKLRNRDEWEPAGISTDISYLGYIFDG